MKPVDYNIDKAKDLVSQLETLLLTKPQFDSKSADLIIRNLVAGMRNQLNTIIFLKDQIDMELRSRISNIENGNGGKSNVSQ